MELQSLRVNWINQAKGKKQRRLRAAFVGYMLWVKSRYPEGEIIISIDEITDFLGIPDKTAKNG